MLPVPEQRRDGAERDVRAADGGAVSEVEGRRTATPVEALALLDRVLANVSPDAPERARLHHVQGRRTGRSTGAPHDLSRLGSAIEAW